MAENHISLINAGPRLNAGLKKTPGQHCRILNKHQGHFIEKIQYTLSVIGSFIMHLYTVY